MFSGSAIVAGPFFMGDRMEIASLAIAVDSREVRTAREWLDHLTGAGTRAERSLGRVGAGGKTAASGSRESAAASREAARAMDSQASSAQRLTAMIRSYATAVVGAFGAREIIQAADAWQGLENRLRLVTRSHTELQVAMNDVYGIAQRTSQQIDSVGQVYQRFAMNSAALGISQQQVAQLAETTAKAIAVSGSEAAAAEGALMQFGQALAAGVLRGEEFNSVMEGAPGLAQALAHGLGVPVGALRALAAEGTITGDKIVEALTKARDSVDSQFETRIKTVSQAMVELGNSVTRYIGELSGATGASAGLADDISTIAEAIDRARSSMDGIQRELDAFRTFGELVVEAWDAVDEFGKGFQEMLGASGDGVASLGDGMARTFEQSFLATAKELDDIYGAFMGSIAGIGAGFRTLGENIATTFEWGFARALASFSTLTVTISDWLNATFNTNRFNFKLADDPGELRLKSLREEITKAQEAVEGTLGAHDALLERLEGMAESRAWVTLYSGMEEGANQAAGASSKLIPTLDDTKKKLTEAQKAQQAFERSRRQYLNGLYGEISALQDQARGLEDQIALYGLAESAKYDLAIADLEAQKAALAVIDAGAEEIAILERKIELLGQMRGSQQTLERLDAEKAAWEAWARDVETIFDQVGQSLTDALFEGGRSGRDLIKDLFKTLTLRVLIQPIMGSIQGMVTNQLGGMLGLSNPGGNVLGMAQNASSLYGAVSGGLTGNVSNAIGWVGEKIGSTALQTFAAGMVGGMPTAIGAGLGASLGTTIGTSAASMATTTFSASLGGAAAGGSAAAGGAAGLGAAFGAALPWIGGALAVGSMFGLFGDDTPKTRHGQRARVDFAGDIFDITSTDDRQPGAESSVQQLVKQAVQSANAVFKQAGIDAAIDTFYAMTESSVLGDRQGVASGGMLRIGDALRQIGIRDSSDMTFAGFGGWSEADMLPRLQTDIQLSILQAFQAVGDQLPRVLADMVAGVDIRGLDEAGAQDLANRFNLVIESVSTFLAAIETMPFEYLRDVTFDAAANMVQFAGGIDNLLASQQTYYERFYSDAERHAHSVDQIAEALAGVGAEMPALVGSTDDMLASYRALVESLDLNTEAGQQAYVTLMQTAGAFADVAQFAGQAAVESQRIADQARTDALRGLESAYNAVVQAGQREIARLQESFGATDNALNAYRSAVQRLESEFNSLFSAIDRGIQALRGTGAAFDAQYHQARAVISTTLLTGQLPQTADLSEAIRVAQQGVMGQRFASREDQQRAYLTLANELEGIKGIAKPELDAAQASLKQLEKQYNQLRGIADTGYASLSALEKQLSVALATEANARAQIAGIESQLDWAEAQYNALIGIHESILDLTQAILNMQVAGREVQRAGIIAAGSGAFNEQAYLEAKLADLNAGNHRPDDYSGQTTGELRDFIAAVGMTPWEHYLRYGQYEDIPGFDVGTNYVPYDMTARIHEGERIIPAADNRELMRKLSGPSDSRELMAEVRQLRAEVAGLRGEQKTSQFAIAKYTQKTAKKLDEFSEIGMPVREGAPA